MQIGLRAFLLEPVWAGHSPQEMLPAHSHAVLFPTQLLLQRGCQGTRLAAQPLPSLAHLGEAVEV